MNIFQKIFFLVTTLLISSVLPQQSETISLDFRKRSLPFGLEEKIPKEKPIVGLALSGGGARAISQIGVLKALEENGIEFEIIVGTSMGSIIGGLYSIGYSINELETIVASTDWDNLLTLGGDKKRRDLFIDQKITEDRAIFSLRLDGFNIILPTAFNEGQRLSNHLYLLTKLAPINTTENFDNLKYKFRAVCTDLENGEPFVVDKGPLSKSMRASSSVTFFLEPVNWDGRVLIDGGLLSNIPVDITKETGAEFIIAVNTTSPLHTIEQIDAPWIIADQVVSIPMKKLNEIQLEDADYVITPNLNDFPSTRFTDIDSLINLSYLQTQKEVKELKRSIESKFNENVNPNLKYYKNVIFENKTDEDLTGYRNKYIALDSVSSSMLKKDLIELYESGKYENIAIDVTTLQDTTLLEFKYNLNPVIQTAAAIGITKLDIQIIEKILSGLDGEFYDENKIVIAISKILRLYRKSGFLLADIKEIDFDDITGNLMLYFDEGLISKISVEGNFTKENLIRRELPINEGDYFQYGVVKEGLDNLTSSGFFKDILLLVREENEKNTLIISVDEKPSGILRFGFLADETYNAQFSLDIREENIFGSGTEAGIFMYGGTRNGAIIMEMKNHRVLDTYLTYNLSTYYKFSDIGVYSDKPSDTEKSFSRMKIGEYVQSNYGLSLSVGTQIEKFGNLIFTGKYQIDEIFSSQGDVVQDYITKVVSLGVKATVDNMDQYPYPLSGLHFTGFYETAQSFLGGDESFTSIGMDLRYFMKIDNRSTLVPRVIVGFGDNTMPLSQQFLLGGMTSFFGMRENEFRGRQIFLTSLMYRLKLPFQIFFDTYLKLRYDLGSTWEEQSQIRFKDLRHGFGGIISFDTPIGPAEFAIGRSFLIKSPGNVLSWGEVFFYFSLGYKININPSSF